MTDADSIRRFFSSHGATAVGTTPPQPEMPSADEVKTDPVALDVECEPGGWKPKVVSEAPTQPGESPERFIDGSQDARPVLYLRAPGAGWPIPVLLAEVGAVAVRLTGRRLTREFAAIERVLSFVADPFPWEEVEAFGAALVNNADFRLRVVAANMPDLQSHNPFDYEVMRRQAFARVQQEMTTWERLALAVDRSVPTLIDGPLNRVMGQPPADGPLVIGVTKIQAVSYLHEQGWRTLLSLRPGQRTPAFRIAGLGGGRESDLPVASWYLKLAGGPRLAPNWGYVRVEVPWVQFERFADPFGFVNRLSRWIIDARCRRESYPRMPVSLEPIVYAEESLKPLFSPFPVLAHRLYRHAGVVWSPSYE